MCSRLERALWIAAALLIAGGALVGSAGWVRQSLRLAHFDAAPVSHGLAVHPGELRLTQPDVSDWSQNRTRLYERLQTLHQGRAAAVLRIPDVGVEAEIFADTSETSLSLGIGHIEGTAAPGELGNIGLAGHRDGFFRRLKDIRPGQIVHVITADGRWRYEVEDTRVVPPGAIGVLAPSEHPVLTLVTCYPFYFLGPAPERFIVRARLVPETGTLAFTT